MYFAMVRANLVTDIFIVEEHAKRGKDGRFSFLEKTNWNGKLSAYK